MLGGQGAGADGTYPLGDKRKAICEMKHFDGAPLNTKLSKGYSSTDFAMGLAKCLGRYLVPARTLANPIARSVLE